MRLGKNVLTLGIAIVLLGSSIVFSEPGTESDPVISLSYLNVKLEELKTYVDKKISELPSGGGQSSGGELVVVELKNGQMLIAEAGTELIKRSGQAIAVTNINGEGLSDVTSGVDIGQGKNIPDNHLLIIPRTDGRGIYVTQDRTYVMIRGNYIIQ